VSATVDVALPPALLAGLATVRITLPPELSTQTVTLARWDQPERQRRVVLGGVADRGRAGKLPSGG